LDRPRQSQDALFEEKNLRTMAAVDDTAIVFGSAHLPVIDDRVVTLGFCLETTDWLTVGRLPSLRYVAGYSCSICCCHGALPDSSGGNGHDHRPRGTACREGPRGKRTVNRGTGRERHTVAMSRRQPDWSGPDPQENALLGPIARPLPRTAR